MNSAELHESQGAAGLDITTRVTVRFLRSPVLRFEDVAVIAPQSTEGGALEEILAEVTGADRFLATDPYYVLSE